MDSQLRKVMRFLESLNEQTNIISQEDMDEHYENIKEHMESSTELDKIINNLSSINQDNRAQINRSLFDIYLKMTDYAWYFSEMSDLNKKYLREYEKKRHVASMDEFFLMPFGKSIAPYLRKSTSQENGHFIYQVMQTINSRLLQGYGVFLSQHKNYLEIADHTGEIQYVLNFDGTTNLEETRRQVGRVVAIRDNEWRAENSDWRTPDA